MFVHRLKNHQTLSPTGKYIGAYMMSIVHIDIHIIVMSHEF